MIPYLKNNDWDNGIKNGYDAFYSEIVKLNNLSLEYNEPLVNEKQYEDIKFSYVLIIILSGLTFGYSNSAVQTRKT